MRIGSKYSGIVLNKDYFRISLFPFAFEIMIFRGIQFSFTFLIFQIDIYLTETFGKGLF